MKKTTMKKQVEVGPIDMKLKKNVSYQSFSLLVSNPSYFGGKCPLCDTKLTPMVEHRCSNGVPE